MSVFSVKDSKYGGGKYSAAEITAHYGAVAVGDAGEGELKSCRLLGKKWLSML